MSFLYAEFTSSRSSVYWSRPCPKTDFFFQSNVKDSQTNFNFSYFNRVLKAASFNLTTDLADKQHFVAICKGWLPRKLTISVFWPKRISRRSKCSRRNILESPLKAFTAQYFTISVASSEILRYDINLFFRFVLALIGLMRLIMIINSLIAFRKMFIWSRQS